MGHHRPLLGGVTEATPRKAERRVKYVQEASCAFLWLLYDKHSILASDGYTRGLLLTQHLHEDGLVKEGKHEDKARNFLLLVLCGSKSREATSNRDRERGPLLQPRRPQTALSSLQAHGGKFHLACVVFSWSVLRMCIIQISYLHDTGFTNSTAINAFHSAPVVRRVDCKVLRSFTWVLHK